MNTTTATVAPQPPPQWPLFYRTFCTNKGAVLGLIILVVMILLAIFASVISPHSPYELFTGKEQLPPMFLEGGDKAFPLGTDDAGRDTLSRLLYGARYSLFIGLCATLLSMIVGISLGLSAAFWSKFWGKGVMLVNDILMSYPGLLLAIIIAAILGPSMTNTIITIALVCLPPFNGRGYGTIVVYYRVAKLPCAFDCSSNDDVFSCDFGSRRNWLFGFWRATTRCRMGRNVGNGTPIHSK